jgi:hypothetical protein
MTELELLKKPEYIHAVLSNDAGADWLDEHMDRAEKAIGAFYSNSNF